MKENDTIFHYTGFHGCASRCRLRIFEHDAQKVAVLTETGDNTGTSVTNAIECITAQICARYGLAPAQTIFIEHYPDERPKLTHQTFARDEIFAEHFDRVTFGAISREGLDWALASPQWKRMAREQVERLTGKVWEPEFENATK